ncbi:MAG: putative lipid II flippase FtsW [Deltaproteobacteria bacterium]|nr:putative lipid II flippase FtsW [Deltaproteobacteria bacterium]
MLLLGERRPDVPLLVATLCLLFVGVVMVYSSSSFMAEQRFDSQYYFLKRQFVAILAGLALMWGVSRIDYRRLDKLAVPLLVVSFLLLLAVLTPGIGVKVGGAKRWLHAPGFNFQPAEVAKIAIILYGASLLARRGDRVRESITGFLPVVLVGGMIALLLLSQPDFGGAAMVAALVLILLFVAGTKITYLAYGLLAAVPVLVALVASSSYRRTRILSFIDPWASRSDAGYQIVQSFLAFGAGGWHGVGLGDGRQKLLYLPEAHTDFIFSVVGEELGLIGVLVIIGLYGTILWGGIRIAMRAPDPFGAYLAVGLTSLLGLQAIMNMGVVMGLLPTKGLTLPLVSYGGSSMLMSLAAVGMLLAIGMRSPAERR